MKQVLLALLVLCAVSVAACSSNDKAETKQTKKRANSAEVLPAENK